MSQIALTFAMFLKLEFECGIKKNANTCKGYLHLFANTHIYSNIYNIASNIAHFHSTIVHLKYFFMEKSNKKKITIATISKKKYCNIKIPIIQQD